MPPVAIHLSEQDRRDRLAQAVARVGGKAELGRRLGHRDGAFIGQMLRGQRPITEKTLVALVALPGVADLFTANPIELAGVAVAKATLVGEITVGPSLAKALPVVLDALRGVPAARWASVRAQLDQVVASPEMRDDVLAELLLLLGAEPGKQSRVA